MDGLEQLFVPMLEVQIANFLDSHIMVLDSLGYLLTMGLLWSWQLRTDKVMATTGQSIEFLEGNASD
jgi:hypothetical protein